MSQFPPKPVLPYQPAAGTDWVTLQWFASRDEATADMVELSRAAIVHGLVETSESLRRPNGLVVRLQLRVPVDLEQEASKVLEMPPTDLANVAVAVTDAGEHPIEIIDGSTVGCIFVPMLRFDTAWDLVHHLKTLERAGVNVLQQRLVSADSPLAMPVTPGCFIAFVRARRRWRQTADSK